MPLAEPRRLMGGGGCSLPPSNPIGEVNSNQEARMAARKMADGFQKIVEILNARWHREGAGTQPTWRRLVRMLLLLRGQPDRAGGYLPSIYDITTRPPNRNKAK